MQSPPTLTISALGAFQLTRDGKPAPKFKYLDARELVLYLMCHTTHDGAGGWRGLTKQEIGAALWGDISASRLNARFKARLNDARRVLGAKEWIVFEEEEYKFNFARDVFFDVRVFEKRFFEADVERRAGKLDAERDALQQVIMFARGEFMQDYHTRRKKDLLEEREWYLELRESLQNKLRRALERLGQIELDAGRYEQAIEVLRKLVALDEYDDGAHRTLMLALALQGKRSQALRHYQNILKQRADMPPDAELVALFEKIKRNENVGERKSEGERGVVFSSVAKKIPPPFQVPADLPRFVGRTAQFQIFYDALQEMPLSPVPRHLCLVGMGGIGKTSLAIHAAYRLRAQFPDGVLWGNLRESEPLAIVASWERAFGCDFSGLPDLNARAASLRSLLHEKKVLVILDDVVDAADARPLVLSGEQTRMVFTSRSADIAHALNARVIEMPVLAADESADLLTLILGAERVGAEKDVAAEICALLGHLPLALDITAQRLASRARWSLREMAERLRAQMQRLDELQLADRAVRATFALSWDALNAAQKNVLAHVGVFDARSFTAEALAFVIGGDVIARDAMDSIAAISSATGVPTRDAVESSIAPEIASSHSSLLAMTSTPRDILDSLVALSLLSFESHTRYRQHPLLADFSREKLGSDARRAAEDAEGPKNFSAVSAALREKNLVVAKARLSQYYLQFATENRKNYLALEDEWDNLNVGIEIAHAQALWQTVIDYSDVLTEAWFARGRFTDARRNYPLVLRGARELEEQDPYIAASLNWGKACIDQGDYAEAEEHLQHGLQTSREVQDEYGIGNALFLLGRVAVERSEYDAAQKFLEESQLWHEKLGDKQGLAKIFYMQARTCQLDSEPTAAARWCDRALEIHETIPVDHSHIVTLRYRGRIAGAQGTIDQAEQYCHKALTFAEKLNDLGEYAAALYELADIFRWQERNQEAMEYATMSLDFFRRMGDRKSVEHALEQISKAAFSLGEIEVALTQGELGLSRAREMQDRHGIMRLLVHLGDVHESQGSIADTCKMRSEALPLMRKFKHPRTARIEEWIKEYCRGAKL